jgi:hypothetical protein
MRGTPKQDTQLQSAVQTVLPADMELIQMSDHHKTEKLDCHTGALRVKKDWNASSDGRVRANRRNQRMGGCRRMVKWIDAGEAGPNHS